MHVYSWTANRELQILTVKGCCHWVTVMFFRFLFLLNSVFGKQNSWCWSLFVVLIKLYWTWFLGHYKDNYSSVVSCRCCCGRLVRQHAGFTASLATKYSDVKLGKNSSLPNPEEWSVEKHTEASPTDAYGVINFQGGSHSYKAKVKGSDLLLDSMIHFFLKISCCFVQCLFVSG